MWLLNNFHFATLFAKISPSPLSPGERTDDQECKEAQKIIYVKKNIFATIIITFFATPLSAAVLGNEEGLV